MATDRINEVRVAFLNSTPIIRPYLEFDVDLLLRFNEILNTLAMDHSNIVCETAGIINEELRRNRSQI
jgi:hypothetical protein